MQGSGPPGPDLRNPGLSCGTERPEVMKEILHSFIEPKGKTVQGTMKSASQQIRTLSGIGLAPFSRWLIFSLRLLLRVETAISYQKIDPFSPHSLPFTGSTQPHPYCHTLVSVSLTSDTGLLMAINTDSWPSLRWSPDLVSIHNHNTTLGLACSQPCFLLAICIQKSGWIMFFISKWGQANMESQLLFMGLPLAKSGLPT